MKSGACAPLGLGLGGGACQLDDVGAACVGLRKPTYTPREHVLHVRQNVKPDKRVTVQLWRVTQRVAKAVVADATAVGLIRLAVHCLAPGSCLKNRQFLIA